MRVTLVRKDVTPRYGGSIQMPDELFLIGRKRRKAVSVNLDDGGLPHSLETICAHREPSYNSAHAPRNHSGRRRRTELPCRGCAAETIVAGRHLRPGRRTVQWPGGCAAD